MAKGRLRPEALYSNEESCQKVEAMTKARAKAKARAKDRARKRAVGITAVTLALTWCVGATVLWLVSDLVREVYSWVGLVTVGWWGLYMFGCVHACARCAKGIAIADPYCKACRVKIAAQTESIGEQAERIKNEEPERRRPPGW